MNVSITRDFDIRLRLSEGEFKAVQNTADVLGYSSVSGMLRRHVLATVRSLQDEVSAAEVMNGIARKGPARVERGHLQVNRG